MNRKRGKRKQKERKRKREEVLRVSRIYRGGRVPRKRRDGE